MLRWISENAATIVIAALLAVAAAGIIISVIKNKRKGKTTCGGCGSCAMSGMCHRKKE